MTSRTSYSVVICAVAVVAGTAALLSFLLLVFVVLALNTRENVGGLWAYVLTLAVIAYSALILQFLATTVGRHGFALVASCCCLAAVLAVFSLIHVDDFSGWMNWLAVPTFVAIVASFVSAWVARREALTSRNA